MLDQTTKRKLDSVRQILVGKVPDPKAQVEQITTALIYKFMDDMDKENEEVGLKTQFFVRDFQKFSWTKLLDNKLSGQDRLDLYVQAITNMPKNPHIPQLFRNIFKGAFLPYNDSRTLSLFLKEINEFNYEHSENLGNAFEYLLSILGSQGDAGQFRTPRHIIDFIVEVVDPKKNETILDPACGTAGFLISAYKHILQAHKEKALTPDEKLKLMNNFAGYDISPDMVKLALVNMYLHGFPEPKIYEYDTLSSENRWDETFDVIMANPPFMTPKGGIVPHKRFSIQANRAEVLFVDYIVEHLTIKGRAGIIVPEGIIFQSNKAYTQLRKKLVEDGLFAVVSLPAGVFNPYSGVKTSILLFDNEISKKTENFLFLKIENDGFDLGAQRREHNKNDLPLALEIINKYKEHVINKGDESFIFSEEFNNEDRNPFLPYNVKLKDLARENRKNPTRSESKIWNEVLRKKQFENYKFLRQKPIDNFIVDFYCSKLQLVIEIDGDSHAEKQEYDQERTKTLEKYGLRIVQYTNDEVLNNIDGIFEDLVKQTPPNLPLTGGGARISSPDKGDLGGLFHIVAKEKIIGSGDYNLSGDRYKEVVNYANQKWPMVELGEVCELQIGAREKGGAINNGIPSIGGEQIAEDGRIKQEKMKYVSEKFFSQMKKGILQKNDILIVKDGATTGKTAFYNGVYEKAAINEHVYILRANNKIIPFFLYNIVKSIDFQDRLKFYIKGIIGGISSEVKQITIPLPPIEVQKEIVEQIEVKQNAIEAAKAVIQNLERERDAILVKHLENTP